MSKYGYLPNWVLMSHFACSAANQAATFGILILVARGWLITRRTLPVGERQTTTTLVLLLFVLNFAYRYSSFNNMTFFALAITYMTILAIILSNIARNVRELKMQLMILRQADIDPVSTPAHTKTEMFRKFQLTCSRSCTRVRCPGSCTSTRGSGISSTSRRTPRCASPSAHAFRLREPNPFNTELGEFSWLPMDPTDLPQNGDAMQLVARMAELACRSTSRRRPSTTYIQKAAMPDRRPPSCASTTRARSPAGWRVRRRRENSPMIRDGESGRTSPWRRGWPSRPRPRSKPRACRRGAGGGEGGALEMILVDPRDARGRGKKTRASIRRGVPRGRAARREK